MATSQYHIEDSSSDEDTRQRDGPPPAYSEYTTSDRGLHSTARITENGRINISLALQQALPDLPPEYANSVREFAVDPEFSKRHSRSISSIATVPVEPREGGKIPKLSLVIMIVGSRGDVQPYLALGQELLKHGHRVRIATHGTFKNFVIDSKLEFFNIGGDPQELMSYMVRNPGLIPGFESLTNGDIARKRATMAEILEGCWKSCFHPDGATGRPFAADAIIANPPCFAHIHCAEALGIPLHISFTMPWCPTTAFPHPLVNISQSNAEPGLTNYLSYALAEMMTWQGLGDIINRFRTKTLKLEELSVRSGPGIIDKLKIPWTYCFSPEIVPKPTDWKNHIDVVGFYFLDLATDYSPPADLVAFLQAGPPPIYIGFGSVVVENPAELTYIIFEATRLAGVRALVSPGWGGLASPQHHTIPPHIFILPNIPHDWLFSHVFAVCHHGGAGTTAIGLRLGKPTIIVPFFGDQPFWGRMVHLSGAGPRPIKPRKMSIEKLQGAIEFCMRDAVKRNAQVLGDKMRQSNGVQLGVNSFHRHLPVLNMRCDLVPERLAVWWSTKHCIKLSAYAAQVLSDARFLDFSELELHRPKEYESRAQSTDPLSGGVVEIFRTIANYSTGIAQIFYSPAKGLINTTTAIPRGMVHILESMHDGMHNTPKLYGSKVRQQGKVKDFQSGLKEGGKGLYNGYYDAITGLWNEPVEGLKKEGFKGLVKGSARSYINATVRPAAGIIGAVASPMRGAWLSLSRTGNNLSTGPLWAIRTTQGKEDAANASPQDKQQVIDAFKLASRADMNKARRQTMEDRMQTILVHGGAGTLMTDPDSSKMSSIPQSPLPTPQSPSIPHGSPSLPGSPPPPLQSPPPFPELQSKVSKPSGSPVSGPPNTQIRGTFDDQTEVMSPGGIEEDEDEMRFQKELEEAITVSSREDQAMKTSGESEEARFEREMKIAMELSLGEEENYELGSAGMQRDAEKKADPSTDDGTQSLTPVPPDGVTNCGWT